jgi:serine/threonine protein kinase
VCTPRRRPLFRALRTALELAQALDYCHRLYLPGCRVLHRDLKPNNIGFMPDGRLCLFDFGLAKLWRIADNDDGTECRQLTGNTGSLRYMAPEVALMKPYSHRAEIFAFATLVWQMISHERPFADCDVDSFYKRVCNQGERPKMPATAPPRLAQMLVRCWDVEPARRPEITEVIPVLEELVRQLGGE